MRLVLSALVATFAAANLFANVEVAPRAALLVLVRNDAGTLLSEAALRKVLVAARDIWRPYAEVSFAGANDVRRYTRPTVDLVLTTRTLTDTRDPSLGWIEFVNGRATRVVTVSVAAARTMMATSNWNGRPIATHPSQVQEVFLTRTLGRAIAHEVGHYLLNSKDHPATGLMREKMSPSDIMLNQRSRELLAAGEIVRLRVRLEELARDAATGDGSVSLGNGSS